MIPADSGWELNIALAINDRAQADMPPRNDRLRPPTVSPNASLTL
jgi:hypothetical protein